MRQKRFLVALCITIVVGCVVAASSVFFGSPLVRIGMRGRVMAYLRTKYPATEFAYGSTSYDFLTQRRFMAGIRTKSLPEVRFTVVRNRDGAFTDDYLEVKLANELESLAMPVVRSVLPTASVSATIQLSEGVLYAESVCYSPGIAADDSISVTWERANASKDEFLDSVERTLAALKTSRLTLDRYFFWCELGDREYALELEGSDIDATRAQLEQLVTQPGKW